MKIRFVLRSLVCIVLLSVAVRTHAASIGANFEGGGNGIGPVSLLSTDTAGVLPQTNWNNLSGASGSASSLVDSTGAATSVSVSYSTTGGIYASEPDADGGDQKMMDGFLYGTTTVNVSDIPYPKYSVYVYELNNDAGPHVDQTYINGNQATSYFGTSPDPDSPGYVTGLPGAFNYTRETLMVNDGASTPAADYVEYDGLSGSSLSIVAEAGGNGWINGFQIVPDSVPVPEPSSLVLLGVGAIAIACVWHRRAAIAAAMQYALRRTDVARI